MLYYTARLKGKSQNLGRAQEKTPKLNVYNNTVLPQTGCSVLYVLMLSDAASREETFTDYQMDLLRALEMSRLQFLREMGSLRPGSGDR